MLLSNTDREQMTDDVGVLIAVSSETAEIFRPVVADAGSFAGSHEPSEELIGAVPLEFTPQSPEDLKQKGSDGTADFPADANIAEGDVILYLGNRYKVTNVKKENCFGAVTHMTASLEREYKSA